MRIRLLKKLNEEEEEEEEEDDCGGGAGLAEGVKTLGWVGVWTGEEDEGEPTGCRICTLAENDDDTEKELVGLIFASSLTLLAEDG